MGRRPTPDPQPAKFQRASFLFVVTITFAAFVAGTITGWIWPFIIAIPGVLVILVWGYGKSLIVRFRCAFGKRGILGILVTSDSPVWKDYIQANWLDHCGDRFVILNASERKQWTPTPATRLYAFFCPRGTNFCPCIILIRGLRHPLVFRFFYAFRDYKHGNDEALLTLESRLNSELAAHGSCITDRRPISVVHRQ